MGISHPDVPCQLCNADVQHGLPSLCQKNKNLINGEHGGNQREGEHPWQAGREAAWPGRAQAKPRLAPADADAPCGAALKRAWHSRVPLEPMPEGHGILAADA